MTTIKFTPFIGIKERVRDAVKKRKVGLLFVARLMGGLAVLLATALITANVVVRHRGVALEEMAKVVGKLNYRVELLEQLGAMSQDKRAGLFRVSDAIGKRAGTKLTASQSVRCAEILTKKCDENPDLKLTVGLFLAHWAKENPSFDPRASNSASTAKGEMQIIKATFTKHLQRHFGKDAVYSEELAYDPVLNVQFGVDELVEQWRRYLAMKEIKQIDEQWRSGIALSLALTAFRWGPTAADRLIEHVEGGQSPTTQYALEVLRKATEWNASLAPVNQILPGEVRMSSFSDDGTVVR